MRELVLVTLFCVAISSPDAFAQTEGLLAVGGSVTRFGSTADNVGSSFGVGVLIRLKPRSGWGPTFGLGWYGAELFDNVDGQRRNIGHVRMRPILVGYGYTHVRNRTALSGSLLAGYSPNSARVAKALASHRDAGGPSYGLDASDVMVIKPIASLTYAVAPRLGLVGSVAVLISDPKIRFKVDGQETATRWRIVTPMLSVGIVYSFF